MNIHDKYEIDNFLSSNLTYEKKIEILRNEQEFAREIQDIIDEKISDFENGEYVDKMIENRINNLRSLRNWLTTTCVTGIFSGIAISNLSKIDEMISNPQTETKGIAILLAGALSSALFGVSTVSSIKSSYNEMLYKQRISSYQRRLK